MENRQNNVEPLEESQSVIPEAGPTPASVGKIIFQILKEILGTVIPAIIIAFLLTHYVGQKTVVLSQSMEPNLYADQQLIVDKVTYHFRTPERGEIVVIDVDESEIPYIKRVIGLPGETLEIKNNQVWINGEAISEPYLAETYQRDYGPVQIPEGYLFVMGDNRNNSRDSRSIGAVALDHVLARAWVRIWPLEKMGFLDAH
ncbi:MAG: signal peptidase I [Anaerolineae bacterium]|nr:signal peptidase I [Anaerolineae bacterium]